MGICLGIAAAFCDGTQAVLNRSLKEVPTSIIMFYHSLAAVVVTSIVILLRESNSSSDSSMSNYTGSMWLLLLLCTVTSSIATSAQTVAFQSDNTTLIILIANIGVVYSLLIDKYLFDERFKWIELASIAIITVVVLGITI